jgi:hypothetical protein
VTEEAEPSARAKIREVLVPSGPRSVAEPEKELRFTRGAQASLFYMIASLMLAAGVGLMMLSTQKWGMANPPLQDWRWLCIPDLLVAFWLFRLGMRCSRHAYLILTPLGVEIFPFFNARKNLRLVYWTEIAAAEFKDSRLYLHFSETKNSGVIASLRPIAVAQRRLLKKAIDGRLAQCREMNE